MPQGMEQMRIRLQRAPHSRGRQRKTQDQRQRSSHQGSLGAWVGKVDSTQHLRLRHPLDSAVVRQLHVPDHTAVGVAPRRRPQVHAHSQPAAALAGQPRHGKSCAHAFRRFARPYNALTCTFSPASGLMCPSTAEAGSTSAPVSTAPRSTSCRSSSTPRRRSSDCTARDLHPDPDALQRQERRRLLRCCSTSDSSPDAERQLAPSDCESIGS